MEQYMVFSTLLVLILAGGLLRWLYSYATKRRAPDPENEISVSDFLGADLSDIESEFNRARRRFR
jgi:hypothetical protein